MERQLTGPDRGRERVIGYWSLLAMIGLGSALLWNTPWEGSSGLHTLLESLATLVALIVGGLALVRFYSRKQATFLFIGIGFLGAAVLDLNHTLLTSELLLVAEGLEAENLFAWTWTAERVFLSLFLCGSLLAWRQERAGAAVGEGSVYLTAVALTLLNLLFFEWVPLADAHVSVLWMSRPAEFLPGILFLLAFVGYLAKGAWRRDDFEHWLIISLVIAIMVHVAFMARSTASFDGMFDAAHLLKLTSYGAMLTGLLVSVYQTFRREGEVLGALTSANDALAREIEVRARTEEAVKEGRAQLQDFLDNANDLIQSVAPGGKVLYVNRVWKQTLGYTDDQLSGLNLKQILHPAHVATVEAEFARVLRGDPARRFNVEFLAADGRVVILSGSVAAQYVNGVPAATQGIFRDVTEQRIAERQLADSQANLAALVENTGDAIWSVDREHRLITFNSAFSLAMEARTGREPAVGHLPIDVFAAKDVDWYAGVYRRALKGDRHVVLRTDEVDGQLRYFELYANPIQGDEGITGAVLFGKDVTPRVRAEEALRVAKEDAEAANRAKSDFLANMSHELRTPLNSVIGFTNVLLKNKDGHLEERELGFLQRVLANGKHLLELINEVLDLAKIEAGRMELVIDSVDLRQLVVETVQQLEGQARAKEVDVRLIAEVPDDLAPIDTDPAKLKQVIINLVGNALKFTREGSVTVRVDLGPDGATPVAVVVQDTGIGISEDRLGAIFEAFQQAEAGTARKYGGTGLGLTISKSICLLMGYDLIVDSTLGKGSTFTIVMGERPRRPVPPLPAPHPERGAEPAATSEAAGGPGAPPGHGAAEPSLSRRLRGLSVLVIDDEKDSRDLMTHYLEDFGCQVETAVGGADGIRLARKTRPDLITLDLMMPEMSGAEVLKSLKSDPDTRDIPVIVVSIVAGEGHEGLFGAVDLLTKPVEREDLLGALRRRFSRKRGGRVLVVDDEPAIRSLIADYLAKLGLEVVVAENGEQGLDAVWRERPDAVLLDTTMPVLDGRGFLTRLRANPAYARLPVLVLAEDHVDAKERGKLAEMASGIIRKGPAMGRELNDALGSMFVLRAGPAGGA